MTAAGEAVRRSGAAEAVDVGAGRRGGHVAVVDGVLRVSDWRTRSPEVVRYFEERLAERLAGGGDRDPVDLAEALENALKVGVVALSTAGVTANVDYVEKEFQRLAGQLNEGLEQRLRAMESAFDTVFAEESGALARALERYLGDEGELAGLFDPERRDSAVGRLRALLDQHLQGEATTLHRLLDVSDRDSPLAGWRDEVERGFERLRRQLEDYRRELAEQVAAASAAAEARAEEREKGTAKGRDYEERVLAAVAAIADVFGDAVEATGDVAGAGTSRVGDVVVTLNPRDTRGAEVRLVFEAKDKPVGLKPILRELDRARDNRGAAAAVCVASRDDHLPAGAAPFREQGPGRFLCVLDKDTGDTLCLQVAYRLARFWALADLDDVDGDVDVRGIRQDLDDARHQLQNVAAAKSTLTRMRNAVDESVASVQSQLDTLRAELCAVLDRVDARVRVDGDG